MGFARSVSETDTGLWKEVKCSILNITSQWVSSSSFLTFLPPGITVLLSLTVFMLMVAEIMPSTSDSVPLIGQSPVSQHHMCISLCGCWWLCHNMQIVRALMSETYIEYVSLIRVLTILTAVEALVPSISIWEAV